LNPPADLLRTLHAQALLDQCIHCGLCLPACPTYTLLGTELDSPRGRISLIRAAAQGRIELEGTFEKHIQLCLACRSCGSACPSGVQYGALVELARLSVEAQRRPGWVERLLRWLGLRQVMPHLGRLRALAWLVRVYQGLGLPGLVGRLGFLPVRLRLMEGMLPPQTSHSHERVTERGFSYSGKLAGAEPLPAVAFFHGCIQEAFLAGVNRATLRVLQANGRAVHTFAGQTCCGAAHLHLGELEQARELARRNINAFFQAEKAAGQEFAAIINNAGGCGACLKEYAHLLQEDPLYAGPAAAFSARVQDISEFLAGELDSGRGCPPRGRLEGTAVYADSCHLRHAQKVTAQPRRLLAAIPGLKLVELKQPDHCCGSAGVYNLVHTGVANDLLDRKMADIARTGADWIVAANTGCYMQLVYGVKKSGSRARVAHVVELLDESYRREAAGGGQGGADDAQD
jgi:glycolate oxidase iron-sulfur subunit